MKYIKIYNTRSEYNAAPKEDYDMSLIVEEDNYVVFYRLKYFNEQYFTIESLADNNTISIYNTIGSKNEKAPIPDLKYSLNDGKSWTSITVTHGNTTTVTTINSGDKILFKGSNNKLASAWDAYNKISASGNFKVYGNSFSLLYNDNFIGKTEFASSSTYNLTGLFYEDTNLIDASNLILPATILTSSCYNGMFRGCSNLINAPQLPAINLAEECYSSMFEGCTSLVTAPELPATNVFRRCYYRMFCMNRTSTVNAAMTKSPLLPATTLAILSYGEMFEGNGSLTEITCLATNLNSSGSNLATYNWVSYISQPGVFIKNQEMNWSTGNSGIPPGWTVQNYTE